MTEYEKEKKEKKKALMMLFIDLIVESGNFNDDSILINTIKCSQIVNQMQIVQAKSIYKKLNKKCFEVANLNKSE